jgi:hypothetical protein
VHEENTDDTEIAQDSPVEGDIAMEKVEKVVEMMDCTRM